jgi:hypothetical protein
MNATLKDGTTISGESLDDIRRQMNAMLSVDGPRGLTATTDKGHEIHVELYEGQDYIKNPAAIALGRLGGKSRSDAKRQASAANGNRPVKPGSNPRGRPRKITE